MERPFVERFFYGEPRGGPGCKNTPDERDIRSSSKGFYSGGGTSCGDRGDLPRSLRGSCSGKPLLSPRSADGRHGSGHGGVAGHTPEKCRT